MFTISDFANLSGAIIIPIVCSREGSAFLIKTNSGYEIYMARNNKAQWGEVITTDYNQFMDAVNRVIPITLN